MLRFDGSQLLRAERCVSILIGMRKALSLQACLLILGPAPGQIQVTTAQWRISCSSVPSVNFSFSALVASQEITRLPLRSALLKQNTGGLVVRWVTTSESPLLYVFVLPMRRDCTLYSFIFRRKHFSPNSDSQGS